jgi:hypothetical protein
MESLKYAGRGWILWSPGPDGRYDIDAARDYDPRVPISPSLLEKTYDPTNGAVSAGDVWRSQAGTPDQIVLDSAGGNVNRRELQPADLQQITRTMSRDEVYSLLGPTPNTNLQGEQSWWARDSQGEYARLTLTFSPDGRITNMEYQSGITIMEIRL